MKLTTIGIGQDITIQKLAQAVMKTVGFGGEIVFSKCKPDGTPCKLLDLSHSATLAGEPVHRLQGGIRKAYDAAPFC